MKVATIRRRAAPIHFRHASAQAESPMRSMLMTAALKGIRCQLGVAPARKALATSLRLVEMLRLSTAHAAGPTRPRAAGGGLGGVAAGPEGHDPAFQDRLGWRRPSHRIARGEVYCPVAAVRAWLQAAAITMGPALRRVRKRGCVGQ
ncbi:hypothetical protein [Azohydromonas aeria]|uniref:hypothetical protein n=1 Tax=Azohydromonas aeria TaxID=2590212 RepID=UPI0018DF0E4F|nr:hypothetical protein [Azohydromonas aeria]